MEMYSIRILTSQPMRFALTVGGISLCVIMMLFLLGVYRGAAIGSVEYIRKNKTDLWILQKDYVNILRGTSILTTFHGIALQQTEGVETVAPVLIIIPSVRKDTKIATVFLVGYDPELNSGGPPQVSEGASVQRNDEIVLDRSTAAKLSVRVGDSVYVQRKKMKVVGISSGTNAFVIQYAFTTLSCAQAIIGYPEIATCFLVKTKNNAKLSEITERIRANLDDVEVFDHQTFLANNIKEMESGFLPILYTIAALGAIVLTAILSLLLSINILERRNDFAIMKALGSPGKFLVKLVVRQSLLIAFSGCLLAFIVFFPIVELIEHISPELSTISTSYHFTLVAVASGTMSLFASMISIQRLRKIYPLEVFS